MTPLLPHPVVRYRRPAYPTKLEALADPSLLRDNVPDAWLSRGEMRRALPLFLAFNLAGCSPEQSAEGGVRAARRSTAAVVAPIFAHGAGSAPGRGAFGCVAVAAPVFLSEEEALSIIADELARIGITTFDRDVEFSSITITGRELHRGYEWISGEDTFGFVQVTGPLVADLVDPSAGIVIEYVCREDFDSFYSANEFGASDDLKAAAASAAHQVERQGKGICFGAFYDPVRYYSFGRGFGAELSADGLTRWGASRDSAREEAAQLLRLQVRDFVDWLMGQGVI